MNRVESVLVGLVLAIICLLLPFVLCWWTAAALIVHDAVSLPDRAVVIAASAGLGFGILLSIFCLKNWVKKFYTANVYVMVLVYLSLSVMAVACFMGLPIANIALGVLAGLYVGRRQTCIDRGYWESVVS